MTQVFIGERDVVSVVGEEATTYLQGQLSQDVAALDIGSSAWSFILQPQGKVDAWFRITRTGDDAYLLDVDAGFGDVLLARLKRFLLRTKAEISLETWTLHAYSETPRELDSAAKIVSPSATGSGTDVVGPDLVDLDIAGLGLESMSADDYERRRILAGVPAMGAELNDSTIPAEARVVDRSVSFTKGCYTGQELVARVDSRGDNTPRRLRVVRGSGAAVPGDELTHDGDTAGTITSAVGDGEAFVALAYIKRTAFDHAELDLGERSVAVEPVPADSP